MNDRIPEDAKTFKTLNLKIGNNKDLAEVKIKKRYLSRRHTFLIIHHCHNTIE